MALSEGMPSYMAQLLEELGWNQGTRIPLANPVNQVLETGLIDRHNEIQRLKESLILQEQKQKDLNKYKGFVTSEYQENTRLLFAHKQQLEQEVKLKQLSYNECERLERDIFECTKQSNDITTRIDRLQTHIARLLKKADGLKGEVCGERGVLSEWRAALERSSCDISAIEQFTKQDLSTAKALETTRQKLKVEHDKMQERLNQLVSNLNAEERACERISVQVMEGMEQRKQMMAMWTGAVENLRQRDTDIRHIKEDYAVLENESNNIAEQCREQQAFCDQQQGNNADARRENVGLAQQLSQTRMAFSNMADENLTLDSEAKSLQRELSNMRTTLEKLHIMNRQIMEEQHRKDVSLKLVQEKINDLKAKLAESLDKTKSSEKRAKQLEDILNEEERYATQVTTSQQRAMHCSFVEQQKLLALKNEEKLFYMQLKASKAIMSKLDSKQQTVEKSLQGQKEALYMISYQVETIGVRVSHMEGAQAERESSAELAERERRLRDVAARHAARITLLETHADKLRDDMRRLGRDLELRQIEHTNLQSRLKTSMLNVEGSEKELKSYRNVWRRERVEEALLKLRVAHASRSVAGLDDTAFDMDTQRLHLDAAMNERLVEIAARRDMFSVQKRALFEDCGKLRSDMREREGRIEQLKKRYDILIASLGKDESGQQLSVTFFKIKFAAERAELRERGAALDAELSRRARDVSALEATLRLMHAAHAHFMRHVQPLSNDTPEIEELNNLTSQYYEMRDEHKEMCVQVANLEELVNGLAERRTLVADKYKQLTARESEAQSDLEAARERVARNQGRLDNAHDVIQHNARRARKLIDKGDHWRIFQLALWIRDYSEAAGNALRALADACTGATDVMQRFAALVSSTDIQRHLSKTQRRLHMFIQKIVTDTVILHPTESASDVNADCNQSVFSTSSESSRSCHSVASGYTRRLAPFRSKLATKLQEPALMEDLHDHTSRSTVALRVVTLGLDTTASQNMSARSRKSFR